MSGEPWLWLLAGPNGAGKSSTYGRVLSQQMPVLSPDEFARQISPHTPEKVALRAGRMTIDHITGFLGERSSFAVETTLSGNLHLRIARQAKSNGWNLGFVYIGLISAELAIKRVEERWRRGGHNVPPVDVRRRYERSLRNLPIMFRLANEVLVFDNSFAEGRMRRLLVARKQRLVFKVSRLPAWLRGVLDAELGRGRRRALK